MSVKWIVLTCAACALIAGAGLQAAQASALHPPAALDGAIELREVNSLAGLPTGIRTGTFALPGGRKAVGWVLAEPGGRWNPTDVIVDASLPGRRMSVALCDASICALSYERGGIAHVFYVAAFARNGGAWKLEWLARGNRTIADANALRTLMRTRSAAGYQDDPDPARDY